jgi:MFS family permease
MITWGSLTALTALVHTPTQLYLARSVLGAAEAGFFPGVIVYLSHWFIHEDRAKATGNFMGAIPLSFVIGSPIAGWILGHKWLAIEGWRWLFILEGIPAILLGAVAFFFLTDWPSEATWLSPEERLSITQKLREESLVRAQKMNVWQALRSRAVLLLALAAFFSYFTLYSFVFWFPTVLKRRVGLLGAVPYLVAFIAMQVNGWLSDRRQERRWHCAVPLFIGAIALLGLLRPPHSLSLLLGLFTLVYVSAIYLPVFWAIPTEILTASTAATAVGMINAIGNIAGFAGPSLFGYLNTRTGSFSQGFAWMMVSIFASGLLILWTPRHTSTRSRNHIVEL